RIILLIFKVLFMDLFSARFAKQSRQIVLALSPVHGQIDRHHVLIIRAAYIKLTRPFVGLHVTDNEKRCYHSKCRQQHGQLKCHRDERRKRSEVLSTDDHRPVVTQHPNLHHERQRCSCQSEQKGSNRQTRSPISQRFVKTVHGEGCKDFVNADHCFPHLLHCVHPYVFVVEGSKNKVFVCVHGHLSVVTGTPFSVASAWVTCSEFALSILFTSAMLITGKNLANNRNAVKKNPIVRMNSPTSYNVGWNIVQLEGM